MQIIYESIAKWLNKEGIICEDDDELYIYAVQCLLFGLVPIGISVTLGFITNMLSESLLMLLPYILIRKFSGGYHLDSPLICFVISTLLYASALFVVKSVLSGRSTIGFTFAVVSATSSLCAFSPVSHIARKLSYCEQKIFKRITQVISILCLMSYLILLFFTDFINYTIALGMGVILAAFLQFPCLVVKRSDVFDFTKLK